MALPDKNTNIMLDLETTSVAANPCIIELSATHFNLNTGHEYSHFTTIISLDSCREARLHVDLGTISFLEQHIPRTLHLAEQSTHPLKTALSDFAFWVKICHRENREGGELMLWGNGAFSDNKWIESAYAAVGLKHLMPWKYWGHMCVRTFVKQVKGLTGRDFARGVAFRGVRHCSLDDCRHQVRYLVLARGAVVGVQGGEGVDAKGVLPCEREVEERAIERGEGDGELSEKKSTEEKEQAEAQTVTENDAVLLPIQAETKSLPSTDLIAESEKNLEEMRGMLKAGQEAAALQIQNEAARTKNEENSHPRGEASRPFELGLITPETSFSAGGGEYVDLTLTQETEVETDADSEDEGNKRNEGQPSNKRRNLDGDAVAGEGVRRGLVSPESSFTEKEM